MPDEKLDRIGNEQHPQWRTAPARPDAVSKPVRKPHRLREPHAIPPRHFHLPVPDRSSRAGREQHETQTTDEPSRHSVSPVIE
jgi:hypothetical protein